MSRLSVSNSLEFKLWAGMLVFGMHSPLAISARVLQEVSLSAILAVLVSTVAMFMTVGALCFIWLGQWLLTRRELELQEPMAEVLQLRFTQTSAVPEQPDEIESPFAMGER